MIFTVGLFVSLRWFVCLFEMGNIYGAQCMKRRFFYLNVIFTDVANNLLVQYHITLVAFHPTYLTTYLTPMSSWPPLWTDDCTVSIRLENTFCK